MLIGLKGNKFGLISGFEESHDQSHFIRNYRCEGGHVEYFRLNNSLGRMAWLYRYFLNY